MPKSFKFYKHEIRDFIVDNLNLSAKILDVGPGIGTYSNLLRSYGYRMDCIEIYERWIKKYKLKEKYDNVFHGNILDLNLKKLDYNFIILGDVLEHINVDNAQTLIKDIVSNGIDCLVAVPYEMEQGEWHGNVYEAHLQPDLTPEIMKQRYPELTLIMSNNRCGYYVNKEIIKFRFKEA